VTDYTDLIARLRDYDRCTAGPQEAADALEAQARRIAELEYDATYHESNDEVMMRDIEYYRARIAELKAALKPFADKADKAEGPFEPPYPVDYSLWRAARAAYRGETE
jgi:hypothetical protein